MEKPVAFYLQTELLATMQGYRLSHPSTNYEVRAHLFYLSLPVSIAAYYHRLFVAAGLQASYLVGTRARYEFNSFTGPGTTVSYSTSLDNYRRYEVAYVAGAGYRWAGGFGVELRYVGGLTSLFQADNPILYATATGQYTAGVQVQLSYPLVK